MARPSFSINEFAAQIDKLGGYQHSNRFSIEITAPTGLQIGADAIDWQVKSAGLPGRNFSTSEEKVYGSLRTRPYTVTHSETMDITFYGTKGLPQKRFFELWQNKIQDPFNYNLSYYKEYVGQMLIGVFAEHEHSHLTSPRKAIYWVELEDVWPKQINAVELDYGTNEVLTFTVAMQYKRWSRTSWKRPTAGAGPTGISSSTENLTKATKTSAH